MESNCAPLSTMAWDVLFTTPMTIAALTLLSAEVLAWALPLLSVFPGCASPVLSALSESDSVIPDVNSMSSLEFRSAVEVISVLTLCSVYENANPPATCKDAFAFAPPESLLDEYFSVNSLKRLSNKDEPQLKPLESSFLGSSASCFESPAVAEAVSAVLSEEPIPNVRNSESRICVALSEKPVALGSVGCPILTRATPPRVSFSNAPNCSTCLLTKRESPIRFD